MKRSAIKTGAKSLERSLVCAECGVEFVARYGGRASRYCSRECGWRAQHREADASTPSHDELQRLHHEEDMSVAAIGRQFGRSAWWAKQALARRGVTERSTGRAGRELKCAHCGRGFYAKASQIAGGRRFCSLQCKGKGMPAPSKGEAARRKNAASKRGSKNPMWRGRDTEGSIYRVFNVRLKGETSCRNCGDTGSLHLHHIVPRSMSKAGRRDLRNGVTLCINCHMGWHHRRVTIHREILTAEEWQFVSALELLGQSVQAWLDLRYPPRLAVESRLEHDYPEGARS